MQNSYDTILENYSKGYDLNVPLPELSQFVEHHLPCALFTLSLIFLLGSSKSYLVSSS